MVGQKGHARHVRNRGRTSDLWDIDPLCLSCLVLYSGALTDINFKEKEHFVTRLLLSICLASFPSLVAAQVYECERTSQDRRGFVSEKIFIRLEKGGAQASITDNMIHHVHGKPIQVKASKLQGQKLRFKWTVKDLPLIDGPKASLRQTLVLDVANRTYRVNGQLIGYDNVISANGRCKRS